MSYYAYSINLADNFTDYGVVGGNEDVLAPLSRVNLFVGPNNSGKSRFLRSLAVEIGDMEICFSTAGRSFLEVKEALLSMDEAQQQVRPHRRNIYRNGRDETKSVAELVAELDSPLRRVLNDRKIEAAVENTRSFLGYLRPWGRAPVVENLREVTEKYIEMLESLPEERKPKLIYVPILRGLRTLDTSDNIQQIRHAQAPRLYENRTQSDYFNKATKPPEIFTGEALYWRVRDMLLGSEKERQKIREFEEYLSDRFFSQGRRRQVTLIPRIDSDVLVVKIGDEEEKPIYELGDGIQSLIILTFLVFVEEHAFFFIEEPDICLHPGMQRTLIECFCDHPEHQFYVTTHSNHMLDLTLDFGSISVFRFKKEPNPANENSEPQFQIECVEDGDDSVLAQLGVQNSSVFLVNATIWVEGITDRMYLRHYFNLWQKMKVAEARDDDEHFTTYQEDLHYTFVEYGGGNVMHFFDVADSDDEDEARPHDLERLCGRSFLVMDRDDEDAKTDRKERLEELLGDRLHILGCREVENLIPPQVLREIVKTREKKDVGFPEDAAWEDYAGEGIGRWIEANIDVEKHLKYADDGGTGTLYSSKLKREFARWTIKYFDEGDFHSPINELMGAIYGHIAEQNQG